MRSNWQQIAALTLLLLIGNRAVAQPPSVDVYQAIDGWTGNSGIVVTSKVRAQVARLLAGEFVKRLQTVKGMDPARASQLMVALQDGGLVVYDPDAHKLIGKGPKGHNVELTVESDGSGAGICDLSLPPKCTGGVNIMSQADIVALAFSFLRQYPNIHILVQPVPPIDYTVQIDGKTYPATEQGLYGVPSGVVIAVRVQRAGKPPCNWSGRVMNQEQVVMCTL